ncbi:MAG: YcjF family protein [Marinibacterium sp.]
MSAKQKPIVIELDDAADPTLAPPVPDSEGAVMPTGQAMQAAIAVSARRVSPLVRWFWRLFLALFVFGLSLWAWDWVTTLIARSPILGTIGAGLLGALILLCLGLAAREIAGLARLRRLDGLRNQAARALEQDDPDLARAARKSLLGLYSHRPELDWARARLTESEADLFDADALLAQAETELMTPLDRAATARIEAAARQVATATAIVPLALADVAVALTSNLRMIRQIAEIYGGHTGFWGNLRLTRAVMAHLVATGAVAVGDDLIGSVAGGSVLSKLSRRFGEGMINGALTARVGLAAMDVCRPLPFHKEKRPGVSAVVSRALAGLFSRG